MSAQQSQAADFVTLLVRLLQKMMMKVLESEPEEVPESVNRPRNPESGTREGPALNPLFLFHVSHAFSAQPPPTQAQLTQTLGLPKVAISRIVARWVELGVAERQADPDDRRYVRVAFTEDGHKLLRVMETYVTEQAGHLLAPLSVDERETLMALMQRLLVGSQRISEEETSE